MWYAGDGESWTQASPFARHHVEGRVLYVPLRLPAKFSRCASWIAPHYGRSSHASEACAELGVNRDLLTSTGKIRSGTIHSSAHGIDGILMGRITRYSIQ